MKTEQIHERVRAKFPEDVGPLSDPKIDPFAVVKKERILEVWLRTPFEGGRHARRVAKIEPTEVM